MKTNVTDCTDSGCQSSKLTMSIIITIALTRLASVWNLRESPIESIRYHEDSIWATVAFGAPVESDHAAIRCASHACFLIGHDTEPLGKPRVFAVIILNFQI
eukprot:SAG31_NODE_3596_length_4087_cov_28.925025_3_plen_102_part_00